MFLGFGACHHQLDLIFRLSHLAPDPFRPVAAPFNPLPVQPTPWLAAPADVCGMQHVLTEAALQLP